MCGLDECLCRIFDHQLPGVFGGSEKNGVNRKHGDADEKSHKRELESYQMLLKAQRTAFERAKQEAEEWKGRYLEMKGQKE